MKNKRCWVCGKEHTRKSKYCSKACYWHDKKYFERNNHQKDDGGKKMGEFVEICPGIWKPEKEEESITGVLINKEPEDKERNFSAKYHLENKDGIWLVWGCATLDERMKAVNIGDKVRITFKEKKEIDRGRTLNIYKVEVERPTKNEEKKIS